MEGKIDQYTIMRHLRMKSGSSRPPSSSLKGSSSLRSTIGRKETIEVSTKLWEASASTLILPAGCPHTQSAKY